MKINQFSKLDLSLKEFNWLVLLSKSRKKFKEKLLYEKKRDDRELIYRVGEVINIDTFTQLTHIITFLHFCPDNDKTRILFLVIKNEKLLIKKKKDVLQNNLLVVFKSLRFMKNKERPRNFQIRGN